MATRCPKCEFDNTADSKFCKECGTQLIPSEGLRVSKTLTLETPVEGLSRGTLFTGRYEIIEELGAGGMGSVYRVEDKKVNEEVALKLINPEIAKDRKIIDRFSHELKVARQISHRNVCRMYDLGETEGSYFITMEYVQGEDLRSLLKRIGRLPEDKALAIARQVADGLAEAHHLGVIHRDLKPGNIMVDREGNAKIMDFGIARSTKAKAVTATGMIIGTPDYMSPEQAEAKEVDGRSDIYSLGVILYEMTTGHVPFEGETALAVAMKHKSERPRDPRDLNPQISVTLSRLILKCLEKEKEKRFQAAAELSAELKMLEGLPTAERMKPARKTLTPKDITVTFSLRKLLVPALIALVAVVIGIAALFVFRKPGTGPGLAPDLVAVAAFENLTGDPSLDILGRMASDWISQGLSQIGGLKVVPTISVPPLAPTVKPGEKTGPALSPLKILAEQTGAGKVVSGTYYLTGSELQFLSSITETRSRMLFRSLQPVKGSLADRMDVIEKLRQLIMGAMAADLGFTIGDWLGVRPPSYEVYQEFLLGMNAFGGSDIPKSIGHLEKAVKLDPGFMPAHIWLARCYQVKGRWDKAVPILELADQNRDKLTPEMALFSDRLKADSQGKYEEGLRALLELRKLAPREPLYIIAVAINAIAINKPRQVIDLLEKTEVPEDWLKIGTGQTWFGIWSNAHYFLGNHKKELEVIRRAREYYPDALAPMTLEARALAALGRIEEVRKVVDESLLSRSTIGAWTAGRVMLAAARELHLRGYQEAFRDIAGRAVEWYRGRAVGREASEEQRFELAAALYIAEQWEEAGTLIEKLRSEKPDDIDYLGYAGTLAARRGDREEALKISEELKGIDRPFTLGAQTYWRARIAALLGMKDEAVELLRQSFSQGKEYDVFLIQEADFDPLRDFAPYKELMKPKG